MAFKAFRWVQSVVIQLLQVNRTSYVSSVRQSLVTCVQEEKKPDEAGVRIGHNDFNHGILPSFDTFSAVIHLVSV